MLLISMFIYGKVVNQLIDIFNDCPTTQELMDKLKVPSDAELMKIAIDDLKKSSITLEDRQRALNELLFLVEPIDNANGIFMTNL